MGLFCLFKHVARDRGHVVDGIGVGHAEDPAKAAVSRSLKACVYVFLPLKAGVPEVHMAVRKAWQEDFASGIDNSAVSRQIHFAMGHHGDNTAVLDKHVHAGFKIVGIGQTEFHGVIPYI